MLFKPTTLVFLQRGGLLVASKHTASQRLDFPDDIVRNLEVLQRAKFIDLCQTFFRDNDVHGKRLLLILDYSVVFEKVIELDKSGQPDKLMEGFVEAMPFEQGKRACIAVQNDAELQIYATNADLYQAVVEALRAIGAGNVAAITPIAAYDLSDTQRIIRAATDHILKHDEVSKQVDFTDIELR